MGPEASLHPVLFKSFRAKTGHVEPREAVTVRWQYHRHAERPAPRSDSLMLGDAGSGAATPFAAGTDPQSIRGNPDRSGKRPSQPVDSAARRSSLRVAYIGQGHGTSLHRASALRRLGHRVTLIDPWAWLGTSRVASLWVYRTGALGIDRVIAHALLRATSKARPDLIFVNQGEFLGPVTLQLLRRLGAPIVNYMNDNPFTDRDGRRFVNYRRALPYYDLVVAVRNETASQAARFGARRVKRVWMTADEVAHRPRELDHDLQARYSSQVAFIGTWMPERGPFLAELVHQGVPLSLWGDRWQKAAEWPIIAPHWRGPGLHNEDAYAAVIQSAEICLGLLSKGNRDSHTTRSIEIPALGGLLCAERTSEHLELYKEGVEAVFWQDATECAAICNYLLSHQPLRHQIAARGHERALRNNHFNEPMLDSVIEEVLNLSDD